MYTMIFIGMVSVGALMIIISLILMVVWRIPDLFDELTGKKAKRQIKALRDANIGTGAFDGMSTNDIAEMANREYETIKSNNVIQDYSSSSGSHLSENEEEDLETNASNVSSAAVVTEVEKVAEQQDYDEYEEDSDRVDDDRVADVKWVLVVEASSIFN